MAKSKLFTAAVFSSALVLVACGGNTQDEDTSNTTESTGTATVEPVVELVVDEEIVLDIEQVESDAMVEVDDMVSDIDQALLDQTLVFFDFDKSSIRQDFIMMLDAHAMFLMNNPNQNVVLEGHADERGTREYNLGLGENRSKQVATYLQLKGVSAAQIDVVSYGEEKPLSLGKTEANYAENRRVQIVYK
ncbi:peptidoglycan-associated lipoprotein Pal [Reinekea sp.]|jgi:peptidoglycan-associated lipoprotein|uniref:peptidoglycan-associated lipoprotein Pal n=1 Tax=Reinekea sp. TaxID=1970455 RepID=UPI0039898A6F